MRAVTLGGGTQVPQPSPLWSFLGTVNCGVSGLSTLCAQLVLESVARAQVIPASLEELEAELSEAERTRLLGWLGIAEAIRQDFEWRGPCPRG